MDLKSGVTSNMIVSKRSSIKLASNSCKFLKILLILLPLVNVVDIQFLFIRS